MDHGAYRRPRHRARGPHVSRVLATGRMAVSMSACTEPLTRSARDRLSAPDAYRSRHAAAAPARPGTLDAVLVARAAEVLTTDIATCGLRARQRTLIARIHEATSRLLWAIDYAVEESRGSEQ